MQNRLVSVIIPAYNSASYIKDAIDSVLKQTYPSFEIIVINDGSTDDTEEIVLSIKDSRIKYIKTGNRGIRFARNTGIKESGGEYIAFLDSDDVWLDGKLEKQIKVFNEDREAGFCCTDHYIIFYHEIEKLYIDKLHTFSSDILLQNNFIEKLLYDNFIITSSVMVKRLCLENLGEFDTTGQFSMDYELWLRIILNYKAYYIKDRLILKRNHGGNISSNRIDTTNELLYIFNKTNSNIENNRFFEERQKQIISKRIRLIKYELGIEYLSVRDYINAFQYLKDSNYTEKALLRHIAMLIAKLKLGFLVSFINLYRSYRRKKYLVPVRKSEMPGLLVK